MSVRIGFGRADLWASLHANKPLEDELLVSAFAALDGNDSSIMLVADLENLWPDHCRTIRLAVAEAAGISPHQIGIFCTQNHGAPPVAAEQIASLCAAFTNAAGEALSSAEPAEIAYVQAVPQPAGVLNRRKHYGAMGTFSFYYGFDTNADGSANCTRLLNHAIGSLCGQPPSIRRSRVPGVDDGPFEVQDVRWEPIADGQPMPPADDPLVQGVFFRRPNGSPVGCIARWAAHPVTSNTHGVGHSGDYPVYARRRLSEQFGGRSVFLTGPCGNQAPLIHRKSLELARTTGFGLADALLAHLGGCSWRPLTSVAGASRSVGLPVRSFGNTVEQTRQGIARCEQELARLSAAKAPLSQIKAELERREHLRYAAEGTFKLWCGIDPHRASGQLIQHELFALRLGSLTFIGLPGEPFGRFSTMLRHDFAPHGIIVAEECNGYLSYIPTADEYDQGGYEVAAALLEPQAQEAILSGARQLILRVGGRGGSSDHARN